MGVEGLGTRLGLSSLSRWPTWPALQLHAYTTIRFPLLPLITTNYHLKLTMSLIMLSLQLWLQMLWSQGCSFHWWCSPLLYACDQPEVASRRKTFKLTSVHCEERRTTRTIDRQTQTQAHSSARWDWDTPICLEAHVSWSELWPLRWAEWLTMIQLLSGGLCLLHSLE